MPVCEFWFEFFRCPLKFKTALHQLTGSTSWDVNMWTWATSESLTSVCHFLVVCAVCECVHVHLAVACVLLLMHDWVANCVSISSVVSASTCLSESVHCHSLDTLHSLDRHLTSHNTSKARQRKQTLARVEKVFCNILVLFQSASHCPVTSWSLYH